MQKRSARNTDALSHNAALRLQHVSVEPQDSFTLRVVFANGVAKLYVCRFFKNVRTDAGGHQVAWDDQVDPSESEIWDYGS